MYARKLREMYFREGTIPTQKTFIHPIRERLPTDTLEACTTDRVVPAVVNARDEFGDLDLVFPWKTAFHIKRGEHAHVRPFYLKHPETEEEIRVTCNRIDYHAKTKLPYYMDFQRYIVGRPNLIRVPVVPVLEDKSAHFQAGANFHYLVKELWCWSFNDTYPAQLEIDCSQISPNMPVKVGDVERMLPYGMYLHKRYDAQKFHAVARLSITNTYIQRKNTIVEQTDQIKEQRRKMQSELLEKKKVVRTEHFEKSVPNVVKSAKFIMAEKKTLKVIDEYTGLTITMAELQERSKEGGGGAKRK